MCSCLPIHDLHDPPTPSPPQDKRELVEFGAKNRIDFVALSFTRSAADVDEAREFLASVGMASAKIIARIENKVGGASRV